jgi:acetoin utilization deacetylase AcuC-like enzyme
LDDEGYLQILARNLPDVLSQVKPDLVFFDAGVDTHADDRLGKLCLSDTGLYRREMLVLSNCLAARIPVACVIGGGYADDLAALVYRHSLLHRAAKIIRDRY